MLPLALIFPFTNKSLPTNKSPPVVVIPPLELSVDIPVTSKESNSTMVLNNKLIDLERESNVNLALLMTGAIGLSSEGGETQRTELRVGRSRETTKTKHK